MFKIFDWKTRIDECFDLPNAESGTRAMGAHIFRRSIFSRVFVILYALGAKQCLKYGHVK
jgi:hypothetical protein